MITSLDQVTVYPLCWPDNKPRAAERVNSYFKTGMAKAQREIEEEMRRWGAERHVISMAPAYRRGPVDPGVALWWETHRVRRIVDGRFTVVGGGELRVLACDNYPAPEANLHAIALTLEGLRAFERYGTYTREQAIEGARLALPPPTAAGPSWWDILGVERNWPLPAIEAVWKTKVEKAHPDRGGSTEEMTALNEAISAARKELRGG